MLGGTRAAIVEADAMIAAMKGGLYPSRFIGPPSARLMTATSAVVDPDISEKNMLKTTTTCDSPPRICPTSDNDRLAIRTTTLAELMSSANVVVRIANLSLSLVGHIRGGLSQVVVVFSMFFSEMSGSTTADVAVMSRALGGPMKREGYTPAFIAAIIASASTIAALVPPSITAVVYGAVGNVSIAGLFMAGVVPGMMIGFGLMIYCYFFGPSGMRKPRAPLRQIVFAAGDAALPLMIPVILLGGILTGYFTPTEAGVVAVVWIIAVVIPALNRGHIRNIPYDFCLAGLIFSLPLITIGAANAFGWMLAYLRGAIVIADWITSIAGSDPQIMMLLLVLLFTVVGDFIEPVPTIIIFMPLVNALTQAGDINGVHMGVVLIATLA